MSSSFFTGVAQFRLIMIIQISLSNMFVSQILGSLLSRVPMPMYSIREIVPSGRTSCIQKPEISEREKAGIELLVDELEGMVT